MLLPYLEKHGQHVDCLKVCSSQLQPLARLPCSRLQSLELHRFKLQRTARSGQPGLLQSATGLTKLCLPLGNYFDGRNELTALTALKKLQHLQLQHTEGEVPESSISSWLLPSAILPGTVQAALTALTFLHMPVADDETFQHISSCAGLQRLKLPRWDKSGAEPSDLSGLKDLAQLSRLSISSTPFTISTATTPELAALTGLKHLKLADLPFHPDILAKFTKLEHLKLDRPWMHTTQADFAGAYW